MQGKYILLVLIVIFLVIPLGGASTNKISQGAPVFIGEKNVDISSAINQCRIIAWWPEGSDTTTAPAKNITLRPVNEVSYETFHYNFSPADYAGYTGKWYCEDTQPYRLVFEVFEPEVTIRVWDIDADKDVTGTPVTSSMNITYRIDTNLDKALKFNYRPELTLGDTFFTVKLTDPFERGITNLYSGNIGAKDTQIMLFDNAPFISESPYYWRSGSSWNRASRGTNGEFIYPAGTYHFTVTQNLNNMKDSYTAAGINADRKVTSVADLTLVQPSVMVTTPVTPTAVIATTVPDTQVTAISLPTTVTPATTPVPVKTTYQPLPEWIALAGMGIAATFVAWQRK